MWRKLRSAISLASSFPPFWCKELYPKRRKPKQVYTYGFSMVACEYPTTCIGARLVLDHISSKEAFRNGNNLVHCISYETCHYLIIILTKRTPSLMQLVTFMCKLNMNITILLLIMSNFILRSIVSNQLHAFIFFILFLCYPSRVAYLYLVQRRKEKVIFG